MNPLTNDLEKCLAALNAGGLILYPTDTVWGMGCDATDSQAVERLFALKRRPGAKAMLILAADPEMAAGYVADISPKGLTLLSDSERPTTVVFPGAKNIAPHLKAADGSVGIRVPKDDFCVELCRGLGRPIVSTSVNLSGEVSAKVYDEIPPRLMQAVDYVAETGHDRKAAAPSRIVKIDADDNVTIIRE